MRRVILYFALFFGLLAFAVAPARALFHLMVIDEIYPGHAGAPDAHYVMLRMTFSGQNLVGGHSITTFFSDGTPGPVFGTFATSVPNGTSGARILMATQEAFDFFGITPDHITTGRLPFPSGRICFSSESIDCVAYGDFTGSNGFYGSPAVAEEGEEGLERGLALHRTQDTMNNAADLELRAPRPINNAGALGGFDGDGDGVPNFSDCATSDPLTWFAPPEITGVRAIHERGGTVLVSWDSLADRAGPATLYDLVLGSTGMLQATGSFLEGLVCGGKSLLGTSISDSAPVVAGDGRLYLIRGRNGCDFGTYGRGAGTGDPDPRSLLDEPLNDPCL